MGKMLDAAHQSAAGARPDEHVVEPIKAVVNRLGGQLSVYAWIGGIFVLINPDVPWVTSNEITDIGYA
jgi:hypothetical protein